MHLYLVGYELELLIENIKTVAEEYVNTRLGQATCSALLYCVFCVCVCEME